MCHFSLTLLTLVSLGSRVDETTVTVYTSRFDKILMVIQNDCQEKNNCRKYCKTQYDQSQAARAGSWGGSECLIDLYGIFAV